MSLLIIDEKNILNVKLKIKKPFTYGNNTIFDLYNSNVSANVSANVSNEKNKNQIVYLQSPSMLVPLSLNVNDIKNTFTLILCEYKSNKYTENINKIIKKIIEDVIKRYPKIFENKIYVDALYIKPFNPIMFQFKNIKSDDIEVYNIFKEKISFTDIFKDDMVTCIYNIKNIWVNETNYGIKLELLQLRRDNYIQKGYIFSDLNKVLKPQESIKNAICNSNNTYILDKTSVKNISVKTSMPTFNLKELLDKRNSILGTKNL